MISRIWHGWTTPQNADKYEALLKEEIFVGIQNRHIRGFIDIQLLRREVNDEVGWKKIEAVIDTMFQKQDKIMIESLGIGEGFGKFHASLAEKYSIKMIRVYADLETCFSRVKTRNTAEHIPVSDDRVAEFNQLASAVTHDWDLEINNDNPASDKDIINAIQSING